MRLWIDDDRPAPSGWTHTALSSAQAIRLLDEFRDDVECVSFDHDLGWHDVRGHLEDDTTRPVVLWMINNEVFPKEARVHTANPVGHEWLVGMIGRYFPPGVLNTSNPNSPTQNRGFENYG